MLPGGFVNGHQQKWGPINQPSNGTGKNSEKFAAFGQFGQQVCAQLLCIAERELQSRESFEFMLYMGARCVVPECKDLWHPVTHTSCIRFLREASFVPTHETTKRMGWQKCARKAASCSLPHWHHLGHYSATHCGEGKASLLPWLKCFECFQPEKLPLDFPRTLQYDIQGMWNYGFFFSNHAKST